MSYKGTHPTYYIRNPWVRSLNSILTRIGDKRTNYYKKGIKNFLHVKDLHFLWFRDKAWLLKKASIDRIDNDGDYTLENCRYIELRLNQSLGGKRNQYSKDLPKKEGLLKCQ